MNILERPNSTGDKITFYYDFGRATGQRPTTGIFIYTKPKDAIQKAHNKQALALLETKKSQLIIEQQAIGMPLFLIISLRPTSWSIMRNMQNSIQELVTGISPIAWHSSNYL